MASPSISENITDSKTKALSNKFSVSTQLAQSEAIKRGIQVSIIPHTLNGSEWQEGWDIISDHDGDGIQDPDDVLIQTFSIEENGLTLTSMDSVFSSWVGFLPSGAVRGNQGISGGFRLCRADRNLSKSRSIIIQGSGNVIVEQGAAVCP